MTTTNPLAPHDTNHFSAALRPTELAHLLGVSRSMLWKLHSSGRLPLPIRLGRSTRWRRAEVLAWLEAGCPDRAAWQARRSNGGEA
ncbi:MAG: helix-turn-helix transcriptional regulator [Phycisphaerales bacterium]